jgi:oxaloacetate decarboxylase alpha subunit
LLASWVRNTPLIIHTRGQSLFTFEFFADDVVDWRRALRANGMRHHTRRCAQRHAQLEIPIKAKRRASTWPVV